MSTDPLVVAIDPGLQKAGIAVVRRSGAVEEQRIVPRENLADAVAALVTKFAPQAIVIGNRTGSRVARTELEGAIGRSLVLVEEHETTLQARERYYRDHPRRGLARLIPSGLFTPPCPLDDYAAVILGERYWARRETKG